MALGRAGMAGLITLAVGFVGAGIRLAPQSPPAADLSATLHPPLPDSAETVWLAPADTPGSPDAQGPYAGLQEGVRRYLEGAAEEALPLLADPTWAGTPLAQYATYYEALARLQVEQAVEAQQQLMALVNAAPAGYLAEGALLGAAEAAEALDEPEVALRLYETLVDRQPLAPEQVWLKIGQSALALGDRKRAASALLRVYYEHPLTEQAAAAATELKSIHGEAGGPGTRGTFTGDLERAERLLDARRHADARAALLDLRNLADAAEDRARVDVRLARSELGLRRYRSARDRSRPYAERPSPFQAEARYVHARATRGLGRQREFVSRVRDLVRDFPDSPWSEAALDALGTHYIIVDDDATAAGVFAELYDRYPSGRHAERAAWKAGWWAWRTGDSAGTVRFFEGAAATFPRSDYRPAYLYWSGRARRALGDVTLAGERLTLAVIDYGTSYYGRLAASALQALPTTGGAPAAAASGASVAPVTRGPRPAVAAPPTASLIRTLIAAGLYDAAMNEIEYARRHWGSSTVLDATRALVLNRQGDLRRAINTLKRAYPQYLTADGDRLPVEVQKIIFPLDYWPLIQKYAVERGIDPYLLAALVAQESTFDASARSGANAYGLMQLLPSTGRRVGRSLGLRRVTTAALTDPETNLRLGTAHLAALIERFGELHLALAAYNAGDRRVAQWLRERPGLSAEEFIDDMPFPETQGYVRRILGTADDYRRLYGVGVERVTR